MNDQPEAQLGGSGGSRVARLVVLYSIVAAVVVGVAILAIEAGDDKTAEASIAGGYDTAPVNSCLGEMFDVKQSGQFVNFTNADGSLSGKLDFEDGKLTDTVDCVDDSSAEIDATVSNGIMKGTLGGKPFSAELKRDPPPAGTPPPRVPDAIDGTYTVSPRSLCLGSSLEIDGGSDVTLAAGDATGSGKITCPDGVKKTITGLAADRTISLTVLDPGAVAPETGVPTKGVEKSTATKTRSPASTVGAFLIAVAVVMLFARLLGAAAVKIRQPRVMGEVVAGIVLGPTILGAFFPDLKAILFPIDIIPFIGVVAQLGLIYYIFLVGLEIDLGQLKGRLSQVAAVSNASVALPMVLGLLVAVPIYELVGPDTKFSAFAIFMGVSMSVTAFPVLARILVERRMLKRPVGALAMASAGVDDVTAWFLIALASAVAASGGGGEVAKTIALAIGFCIVMGFLIRPLVGRVSGAYDEAGRVPGGWFVLILAGVLLSAWLTEEIGVALIFGAFIMGMIMPRRSDLTEDVTHRIEDYVVALLLPLFFVYTGLRTDVGLLDRPELWLLTLVLIGVAIVGKFGGAFFAARVTGMGWRESAVIGTLMNTRGLTELIVLNLALEKGAISQSLFAMLVLMALVTTFAAGPLLRLFDPKNTFGAPVEEELDEARERSSAEFPAITAPQQAILLAPQHEAALPQLRALGDPLARSEPPRELIMARLLAPTRAEEARGGLQTENKRLREATAEIDAARAELSEEGIATRGVAFMSSHVSRDLTRLAQGEEVALVLIDGYRPLLGEGVPKGQVGAVLKEAPCDVAVLVAREDEEIRTGPGAPLIVPFGGAEHDWAALELGAWVSAATGAPLKLLGAAGQTEDRAKASRLLGDAGLMVQQYAGVKTEPVVAEEGREGIVAAAAGAGLLIIGLSERWRDEGLGPVRSDIAKAATAPVLFVRRGTRPGALAPREDVTRFTWSAAGMGGPVGGPAGPSA
jgi:Kef-type K+ transport system membrane component KefB